MHPKTILPSTVCYRCRSSSTLWTFETILRLCFHHAVALSPAQYTATYRKHPLSVLTGDGHLQLSWQWTSSTTSAHVDQTQPAAPHRPQADPNSTSAGLSLWGSTTAPFAAAEVTHCSDRSNPTQTPPPLHQHSARPRRAPGHASQ